MGIYGDHDRVLVKRIQPRIDGPSRLIYESSVCS